MCLVKPAEALCGQAQVPKDVVGDRGPPLPACVLPSVTLGLGDRNGQFNMQVHPCAHQANGQHRPREKLIQDLKLSPCRVSRI